MSIQRTELSPGYPVLEIDHPSARARVALHGAHLMEWQPAGQDPVLYLSPRAVYREGKAIRGGVPLCWPWFGPNAADPSLPSHGFARDRFWDPVSAEEHAGAVRLKFALTDTEATRRLWPHPFRLEMEMHIGKELHLSLHMMNTGPAPFTISGALHSYFSVGDVREIRVNGLDGVEYQDSLIHPPDVHLQNGYILFDQEVDRVYHSPAEVTVTDPVLRRTLTIRSTGSGSCVIWNPWIAKARTLADLPDGDYLRFVCVETTNTWKDLVTIPPGESHTLAVTVSVS